MNIIKRLSEHPLLSLVVSVATVVSAIAATLAWLTPAIRGAADAPAATRDDIVGTWVLVSPPQADWVVDYRSDGTYVFTTPDARIEGTYAAADGAFHTRATTIDAEDRGTYRFADPDTLEMTGQLGDSVWRRR